MRSEPRAQSPAQQGQSGAPGLRSYVNLTGSLGLVGLSQVPVPYGTGTTSDTCCMNAGAWLTAGLVV